MYVPPEISYESCYVYVRKNIVMQVSTIYIWNLREVTAPAPMKQPWKLWVCVYEPYGYA